MNKPKILLTAMTAAALFTQGGCSSYGEATLVNGVLTSKVDVFEENNTSGYIEENEGWPFVIYDESNHISKMSPDKPPRPEHNRVMKHPHFKEYEEAQLPEENTNHNYITIDI